MEKIKGNANASCPFTAPLSVSWAVGQPLRIFSSAASTVL